MKFVAYLMKTLIESIRDWKLLIFVMLFAPCFVFGMYAAFGRSSQSYNIEVINDDVAGNGEHGEAVLEMLKGMKHTDGVHKYKLHYAPDTEEVSRRLKNRSADAGIVIPEGFSETLDNAAGKADYKPLKIKLMGDPRNSRYSIASIYLLTDIDLYNKSVVDTSTPIDWEEELIGSGEVLTDFDLYVPGLVVLALLNVIFTAGAALIKEVEKGTMQRLVLSRLKSWQFIAAVSVIQGMFCIAAMFLTLWAARLCGFAFQGSYTAFFVIGLISGIAIMGISMITASFIKTVYDLLTVGMLPYFLIMLFGGIFFPLPPIALFTYGDSIFRLSDLLPLSLSVSALNKSLNYGWGIGELGFDLAALTAVSVLYYLFGLWAFGKRQMRMKW